MNILVYIALGFIVLYIVITCTMVFYFINMIIKPKVHNYNEQMQESLGLKRFTKEYLDTLNIEPFEVESSFGYKLKGIIENNEISILPENSNKVAILCHGYTSGAITMSGYAKRLLNMGFTCVMYDHRYHGETGPSAYFSMGYFEKYDLQRVMDFCYDKYGKEIKVITCGESMGAATVLGLLEIDERPALTVADCGFADFINLAEYLLHNYFKVPKIFPIIPITSFILKSCFNIDLYKLAPINGVKQAVSPILFCHGKEDTFIPPVNSIEMSKCGPGVRELYLCEHAGHAVSEVTDPEKYTEVLTSFINRNY